MLPIGGTYAGNPIATAAARACLKAYQEEDCVNNAQKMGALLLKKLGELKECHPCIGDVRGQGLLTCVELVRDRVTKLPLIESSNSASLARLIRRQAWENGLHFLARGNLILIAPPLVVNTDQISEGIQKLDHVLTWLDSTLKQQ